MCKVLSIFFISILSIETIQIFNKYRKMAAKNFILEISYHLQHTHPDLDFYCTKHCCFVTNVIVIIYHNVGQFFFILVDTVHSLDHNRCR